MRPLLLLVLGLIVAGCGSDTKRAEPENPLPETYQSTQPLPETGTVNVAEDAAKHPVTPAERKWFGGFRDFLLVVGGAAARLEVLHDDKALQRKARTHAPTAAPFRRAINVLVACNEALADVGTPPTKRTRAGMPILRDACRRLETVAKEDNRYLKTGDPAGIFAADNEIESALGKINQAMVLLLPASEGRTLPTVEAKSDKSRIQPKYGEVASELVGLGVEVRCWSLADWTKVKKDAAGFTGDRVPADVLGYVLGGSRANLSPAVCSALDSFVYDEARPSTGAEFGRLVDAVVILSHETQHVAGVLDEGEAECYGMQQARDAALALGASEAYADKLAEAAWEKRYPSLRAPYRTAECRDGGPLDLYPDSDVWP